MESEPAEAERGEAVVVVDALQGVVSLLGEVKSVRADVAEELEREELRVLGLIKKMEKLFKVLLNVEDVSQYGCMGVHFGVFDALTLDQLLVDLVYKTLILGLC